MYGKIDNEVFTNLLNPLKQQFAIGDDRNYNLSDIIEIFQIADNLARITFKNTIFTPNQYTMFIEELIISTFIYFDICPDEKTLANLQFRSILASITKIFDYYCNNPELWELHYEDNDSLFNCGDEIIILYGEQPRIENEVELRQAKILLAYDAPIIRLSTNIADIDKQSTEIQEILKHISGNLILV